MSALVLNDVTLTLGDGSDVVTALDAVSLELQPGELVAVVGPSGAGKSSLLAVAGALTTPDQGTVSIDGQDPSKLNRSRRARLRRDRIGFVFQSGNLVPCLSARDQLRVVDRFRRTARGSRRDPDALLAEVGMGDKVKRRPHELSGGERQRVGIARALSGDPAVLLVDEPTAALDRARSHEIVELLAQETRARGLASLMVTHDHEMLTHCSRVLSMIDGKLTT